MDKTLLSLYDICRLLKIAAMSQSEFQQKYNIRPSARILSKQKKEINLYKWSDVEEKVIAQRNNQNTTLHSWLNSDKYVTTQHLATAWGIGRWAARNALRKNNIKAIKKICQGRGKVYVFYDRAECERARPFINQPEQKEVEKQMNPPEPKQQTPDIIPADTIDLFTMSELESEFRNRGVELTAEVRNKISASDMPEMQHIAKMLRGNAKTIAIGLSVLNDIAAQLLENRIMNALTATEAMNYLNENLCQNTYEEKTFKHVQSFLSYALCGTPKFIELYPYQESSIKTPALWSERQLIDYCNKNKHNHCVCSGEEQSASKVGRKSKYRSDFPDLVEKFARQGATDKSIAEYLGISQDTFYQYIKKYPEMAVALSDGRNANPLSGVNIVGKSSSERYLMQMQMQINDMQKMIEKLVKKLDGVGVVEKKIYMKNNKVDKVIVTETKLK